MGLRRDPGSGGTQVGSDVVRVWVGPTLCVCPVDEDGSAADATPRFNVPPSVSDHEAGGQIDIILLARLD
jgi:hypothetical protein